MKKLFYLFLSIYLTFSLKSFSMWNNNIREKILNMITNKENLNQEIDFEVKTTTPLLCTISFIENNREIVELLIKNGANINLIKRNSCALTQSISDNKIRSDEICQLLLENKANPNIITKNLISETALIAIIDLFDRLKKLENRNLSKTLKDSWNFNHKKYKKILKLLILYGANPYLKINKNKSENEKYNYTTAIEFAQKCELDEVKKYLIDFVEMHFKSIHILLLHTNPPLNKDVINLIIKFMFS